MFAKQIKGGCQMIFKVKNFKTNQMDYIFYKVPDPAEVINKRKEAHKCWETLPEVEKQRIMNERGFSKNHSSENDLW
jgi:hypothetical protein